MLLYYTILQNVNMLILMLTFAEVPFIYIYIVSCICDDQTV